MDFVLELAKLIKTTPKLCLPMQECENSAYNSFLYRSKDCYLCFASSYLESCMYMETTSYNKDCFDSAYINHCELCYECLDCNNCYNCNFCRDCKQCTDCTYCFDCQGCSNCFGCVGLRKKEYHIFNTRCSKEEYAEKLAEAKKMPIAELGKKMHELRANFPHPPMHSISSENVFGDYIQNSKNCYMCFHTENAQDCGYLYDEMVDIKDCFDCTHIQNCELCYNLGSASECYNVDCSWWTTNSRDLMYCFCVQASHDCFGCVYLQRHGYCILNKQYSKEEYFKKMAEIKDDLRKKGLHGKYLVMDAVELARRL